MAVECVGKTGMVILTYKPKTIINLGDRFDIINSAGSTNCIEGSKIENCDYVEQTGETTWSCYSCIANYAVKHNNEECVSFTSLSNCRKLFTGNANCAFCYHSYYWDASNCVLKGLINVNSLFGILV